MDPGVFEVGLFLKGALLGFSIAAPVGPIGVLCIRRTLANGMVSGFVSGLGAATADGIYGAIAAFGLASLTGFLVSVDLWMRIAGGIFLLWLGWKTISKKPQEQHQEGDAPAGAASLAGNFVSSFFLTLTNPMTIISFTAIFMGVGLVNDGSSALQPLFLVTGVFTGSAAWWLGLSSFFSLFRRHMTPGGMTWINRISGAVLTLFGAIVLFEVLA